MKRQSFRLIAALVIGIGAVVLFILYGPAFSSSISPLLHISTATPAATVVPPTPTLAPPTGTQSPPAQIKATPTIVEITKELSSFSTNGIDVWSLDISPDGKLLATGGSDGNAKIWDFSSHEELLMLNGDAGTADDLSFSPDGARLAVSYQNGTTILWDAKTGEKLLSLPSSWWATSNDFSPDGKQLAVGHYVDENEGIAQIWDLQTGKVSLTLKGHSFVVDDVDFSPDGKRLLTASGDGTAKVWDSATGEELLTLKDPNSSHIFSGAFSPDGKLLVTVDRHKDWRHLGCSDRISLVQTDRARG